VQRTRPDSLTVAQSDSPAGLAAWVVEKFRVWSDCGGDVERSFSKDTLLTNLMFYWAPSSAASSARIYYETEHEPGSITRRIDVATAVAEFPAEPFGRPRNLVEQCFRVEHWTTMPRGGHFAALEEPELLLDDMADFFEKLG
jgi:microsomal epoxide hydrolase